MKEAGCAASSAARVQKVPSVALYDVPFGLVANGL